MAPRSKSTRQLKIRTAPSAEPVATLTESMVMPLPELLQDETEATAPPTPGSASRTYAQAVKSAPPSPRREGPTTSSTSAMSHGRPAMLPPPVAASTEAGHDSLDGTSIRVRNQYTSDGVDANQLNPRFPSLRARRRRTSSTRRRRNLPLPPPLRRAPPRPRSIRELLFRTSSRASHRTTHR